MADPEPRPSPGATPMTWREAQESYVSNNRQAAPKAANVKDPLVYLGFELNDADYKEARSQGLPAPVNALPASQVTAQYYQWDQKTRDKFLTQLALTGQDVDNMPDGKLAALWGAYVDQAASYMSAGKKLTPWDILAKDMAQREAAISKPRTVTSTSTSLDVSSALTARAIFQQATQSLIGRAPTSAETRAFQAKLNAYERANPQVTTTTTDYAGTGEMTGQTSNTTGGVNQAERAIMAEDAIKVDPEYGSYQAATNGMNWLMELVGRG